MSKQTSISIFNSSNSDIEIIHEPEYFIFNLPINEEVFVEFDSCKESIQLKVSEDNSRIIIQILGNNSLYSVLHNGRDAFEKYL